MLFSSRSVAIFSINNNFRNRQKMLTFVCTVCVCMSEWDRKRGSTRALTKCVFNRFYIEKVFPEHWEMIVTCTQAQTVTNRTIQMHAQTHARIPLAHHWNTQCMQREKNRRETNHHAATSEYFNLIEIYLSRVFIYFASKWTLPADCFLDGDIPRNETRQIIMSWGLEG